MLVLLMGFALIIKILKLVYPFLTSLKMFKVLGEQPLNVDEQGCDLMVLLNLWCYLLENKLTKSIVIILN